ncbi:Sensor histidine kinase RcsC [subsurface metagenome]
MPSFPATRLSIKEQGLRYKLYVIGALIFVLPFLIVSYILYKNNVLLEFSQIVIFALTFILILGGFFILHQVFARFVIVANTIKKAAGGEEYLIDMQKDTAELHEITVSFDRLMKKFEETTVELKHSVFELFAIKELTEIASKSLDIDDLLDALLEKAMAVSKARLGSVYMVESEKKRFRVVASRGIESGRKKNPYISFNDSLARLVVTDRKPLLVQDIESDSGISKPSNPGYKSPSFLSMPIFVREDLIAILNLSLIDSNDQQILSIMIGEIGFALENARLHSKIEEHVKDLQERTEELTSANTQLQQEIAERKQAEEEIRKLNAAVEQSIDGIAIGDLKLKLIYVNDAFAEMHGYSPEEMIGTEVANFQKKEQMDEYKTMMYKIRKQGSWTGEIEHIRKDGKPFPTYISATLLKDDEGNPTATLMVARDITDQKNLEAKLHHAQKLEALGTLAGGIAHNFNNLLMGTQGNASLMLLDTDSAHPHYENLKRIEKLVERGSRLTKQLLAYAREGKYEVNAISLNRLVKETSDTFGMTKKEIRVHRQLAEQLWGVKADQGQIERALWNLYVNAADAMPKGGDLFLETMNVTDKDMGGKAYKLKPGNYVQLTFRDTGVGMDRKTMERIFDPFFTTKDMSKSTGLGLASVYGTIKTHGGYIDVDSKKGCGTTFSIYLPATEKRVQKPIKSSEHIIEGTGTILLVDDEPIVLDVGAKMLKTLGYRVLEGKGGRETVKIYQEKKDTIDMVILDMIMPDMGGGEAYDRMKEINPKVKVLLSSGYSIDGQATEILERGCDGFMQKPFSIKELSGKIREILDKK